MKNRFSLSIGTVKNNADPAQHGRLQVFIPSIDSPDFNIVDLPWALYVSQHGGSTANAKVGRNSDELSGVSTYGSWAIPKNGAQVLVGFLEGDPMMRIWMGCFYIPQLTGTLPAGVNGTHTEIDQSGQYPQAENAALVANANEAGLGPSSPHFKTIGAYERSVSYPSVDGNTDTTNGYGAKLLEPGAADSQIYSYTTPGRNYWMMSDTPGNCRIRWKTTAGSQVLLDDTNERIIISSARGRGYFELDEGSGDVYHYGAGTYNIHSDNDVNITSDQNINLKAKKRVNIISEERGVQVNAKMGIGLTSAAADVKVTAAREIHLKTNNGDTGSAVSGSSTKSLPPYAGKGLGTLTDFPEEAGGSTSGVFINAYDDLNLRSDQGSIYATARKALDIRTISGSIAMQSGSDLSFKSGSAFKIQTDDFSLKTGGATTTTPITVGSAPSADSPSLATQAAATPSTDSSSIVSPQHEPWTRPEGPPRNSNYQG